MTLDVPLAFTPVYQTVVWGGRRMAQWRDDLPEGKIGESWDIADQERGMSVVAAGPLAGTSLRELVRAHGQELVGTAFQGEEFPLLVKVLDANDRLSVQVHPDDELAQQLGVAKRGKTECWYLIGDGGELFQGTAAGVDAAAFEQAIEQQQVESCLNRFETVDGDFFFMPARTVHALGTGCLLFEIQQSCDCTFRVYDWGRVGLDGKPRPLHVAESLQTIDFAAQQYGPVATDWQEHPQGGTVRGLASCQYFTVAERRGSNLAQRGNQVCHIVCCMAGSGRLRSAGGELPLQPMHSYLVPAAAGDWQAVGADLRLLVAQPVL
jgi:mannose-6-phosphate isomerase